MIPAVWKKAIGASADPQRAKRFFEALSVGQGATALKGYPAEPARIVATLFGGSQALSNLLVAHPEWLELLAPEVVQFPRRKQGLRNEVNAWLKPLLDQKSDSAALARSRQFKQREMLRIAARDLARFGDAPQITQEISDVADVCLDAVWQVCRRQLVERYGEPYHQNPEGRWQPTTGCVLGLGKLGGQELNYSSDVDVVFVYSEEGSVFKGMGAPTSLPASSRARTGRDVGVSNPRPTLTNHQFFNRLAELFVAELTRMAPEGVLYRIDLRLRPEGDAGPLTRSMEGYENFYAQWGQTWERMMLIKARPVAGNESLGAEFLEMIQPFRYPRSVNESVLREIAAMKERIENEVVRAGELERNVKLGRGGIREIEFSAQSLQLLHAGRQPFLQGAQTLPCLAKLAQYELLSTEESKELYRAYCFLRDVEHRLQMEDERQTHSLPTEQHALTRLAHLMGFASAEDFEQARQDHTARVRRVFERVLKSEASETQAALAFPHQFQGAEAEWKHILAEHGFKDSEKALRVLREFVEGPGYVHVSPRTAGLAQQLLPRLFSLCPAVESKGLSGADGDGCRVSGAKATAKPPSSPSAPISRSSPANSVQHPASGNTLSDPDRVVTRLDSFISAYGARSTLFDLWNSNPAIFELLLLLFDRSEFLAELAIRTPDLVDELVTSGRLRQCKSAQETLADLRYGLGDADQHRWLRRYHEAELMRIGLRDILGLADVEQHLVELSALADACLQVLARGRDAQASAEEPALCHCRPRKTRRGGN